MNLSKFCQIRYEREYRSNPNEQPREGFACWLVDVDDTYGDMLFNWFYPIKDGLISASIMEEINKLIEFGWKIYFVLEEV